MYSAKQYFLQITQIFTKINGSVVTIVTIMYIYSMSKQISQIHSKYNKQLKHITDC